MTAKAVIYGLRGPALTAEETAFFRSAEPWGFILFARNIEAPEQVRALTDSLRAQTGRDTLPILIDQEGGRVARLRPPQWRLPPPAASFAALFSQAHDLGLEATYLNSRLIAHDLLALGINVDCLPVLDVPHPGSHDIIGDRAYGTEPQDIVALGRAAAEGLLEGGVLPILKHIPGHGRARADSHESLPTVDASLEELTRIDFTPFRSLNHFPLAMTAHIVYAAIDPDRPATLSGHVVRGIIRGTIGFQGALMTDDLSMKALSGTMGERTRASYAAGCDLVLHCNGDLTEMEAIAAEARTLSGPALTRTNAALAQIKPLAAPFDAAQGVARLASLLNQSMVA